VQVQVQVQVRLQVQKQEKTNFDCVRWLFGALVTKDGH
jgi:hypothetical protein